MENTEKSKLNCCQKCQLYWTCETKWYRGERHEEDICCVTCDYYTKCLEEIREQSKSCATKR